MIATICTPGFDSFSLESAESAWWARGGKAASALQHAAFGGHAEVVRFLLEHGVDSKGTASGQCRWTAEVIAICRGHTVVADLLKTPPTAQTTQQRQN